MNHKYKHDHSYKNVTLTDGTGIKNLSLIKAIGSFYQYLVFSHRERTLVSLLILEVVSELMGTNTANYFALWLITDFIQFQTLCNK